MSNNMYYPQTYSPCFPAEEQGEWVWVPKSLATTMPGYSATSHESQVLPMYPTFDMELGSESQMPPGPWNSLPINASLPSNNDVIRSLAGSPVEPLQDFNIDMALQLDGHLKDTLSLGVTIPLPDTASVDLFNNLDFTGVDLSSDLDFAVPIANGSTFTSLTTSPRCSVYGSQGLAAVGNNPPQYPSTPASLSPAGSSPASVPSPPTPATTTTQLLLCAEPSCSKTFTKRSDLR